MIDSSLSFDYICYWRFIWSIHPLSHKFFFIFQEALIIHYFPKNASDNNSLSKHYIHFLSNYVIDSFLSFNYKLLEIYMVDSSPFSLFGRLTMGVWGNNKKVKTFKNKENLGFQNVFQKLMHKQEIKVQN